MKRFFQPAILILAAALATASCNKKEPAQQIKSNGLPKAQTEVNAANTVAIVDIDTLASQYEYCKEGMFFALLVEYAQALFLEIDIKPSLLA